MKRALTILGVLVLVLVLGAVGFLLSFDVNRYKDSLVALLSEHTGRTIAIDGEIRFVPAMLPTVAVDGLRIGNAAWDTRGDAVAVKHVEAQVALRPLLDRQLMIRRIAIVGAELKLATNAAGEHNWSFTSPEPAAGGTTPALAAFAVDEVTLENLTLHYLDQRSAAVVDALVVKTVLTSRPGATGIAAIGELAVTAADIEYRAGPRIVKLGLDTVKAASSAADDPVVVAVAGTYGETPIKLRAALGSWAHLLGGERMPFDIDGTVGAVKAHAGGEYDPATGTAGLAAKVTLAADNGATLGALIGVSIPAVAPVSLAAEVQAVDGGLAFRQLKLGLGRSDLAGEGSVAFGGARPSIRGAFSSQRIDLTELLPAGVPAADDGRVFSSTPLELGALRGLDFAGSVNIGSLRTASLTLEQVKADVTLAEGRLTLAPASAGFAGGRLDVRMALAATDVARLDLDLRATGLVPAQLPQLAGKSPIEEGRTDVQLKLVGSGRSVAEIAGSGNGQLQVRVGKGVLPKAGIATASTDMLLGALNGLNPLASQDPRTQLECAVLRFEIVNGLASTDHGLGLRTDKLNVLGGGTVDFKSERIDIGAKPKPRQGVGLNLAALGDFVRLGGTLSKPVPVTDAQGAATAGLKVGAAIATGGISVLAEGLFDRATADEDVCAIAAGEKALPSAQQAAQQAAAPGTAPAGTAQQPSVLGKAADTTKNAVQGVGSAVKGVFKGLFGR